MNIPSNYPIENYSLNLANELVNDFVKQNPETVSTFLKETMIKELAETILTIQKKSNSNLTKDYTIAIPADCFPEAMKLWASVKHIFSLEVKSIHEQKVKALPPIPYTYANTDWRDIEVVTTAKEGVRGAWFFTNIQRGSIVVKGQEGIDKQVMGSVFLSMMGIHTPGVRAVERQSLEGQQISLLGQTAGLDTRSSSLYLVMDRVMGPTYTNLSSADIDLVKNNLISIGELAIYDLVLGNFDRFQLDSSAFNSGNIMFQNTLLYAIDTDCIFEEERDGFIRLAFKKIMENRSDLASKIGMKLATHLGEGVNPDHFSSSQIDLGIKKAIVQLLNITKNLEDHKKSFVIECAAKGITTDFPKHLENNLSYLLSLNKN